MLAQQKISSVAEGMEVYDKDGARVGTIKAFRLGEGTIKTSATDIVTISEILTETIGNKDLPTVMYTRLFDEGFASVDRGFLRSDGIVFPNQIDEISGDTVYLSVYEDELFKL